MPKSSFSLLKVSGPDAKKFLQGQLTCNLEDLAKVPSLLGAHCNPQGRVLFLFRVFCAHNDYYLVLPQEMLTPALAFLGKYAVFFKLELSDVSETAAAPLQALAGQEWQYFDLRQKKPQIYPSTSGKFLPHDLNLQELDGLSWEKGCYTGQEIIARMHYRGKPKNHLYHARIQTSAQPLPGAALYYATEKGLVVGGVIADYLQESLQSYQLLLVANENDISNAPFILDPLQSEAWEWL